MKYMIAMINPHKLDPVREALQDAGIRGMTVTEVSGQGFQGGATEFYRGVEYEVHFVPKTRIEVAMRDDQVEQALTLIRDAASTGTSGDGKVFVLEMPTVMRLRTGERDEDAL